MSLSSNVVSSGEEEGERETRKETMERVLAMSGILSCRPVRRRVVEDSMNWYFLGGAGGVSGWDVVECCMKEGEGGGREGRMVVVNEEGSCTRSSLGSS